VSRYLNLSATFGFVYMAIFPEITPG